MIENRSYIEKIIMKNKKILMGVDTNAQKIGLC